MIGTDATFMIPGLPHGGSRSAAIAMGLMTESDVARPPPDLPSSDMPLARLESVIEAVVGGNGRANGRDASHSPLASAIRSLLTARTGLVPHRRIAAWRGVERDLDKARSGHAGLDGLLRRFVDKGYGEAVSTWIDRGQNRILAPHEMADALGPDSVSWLTRLSGMSRDDLLSQLSRMLPRIVDRLTPDGVMPDGNAGI